MTTLTILRNSEKALQTMLDNECAEFYDYENLIDWEAIRKSIHSITEVRKIYESNSVRKNAKARKVN